MAKVFSPVTICLQDEYTMLKDQVNIKIQSGKGGKGSTSKFSHKLVGGDGGNGGKVYLKGSENMYDLGWYDTEKTYKAENGENGLKGNKKGSNGKDIILSVPLVTEVVIDEKVAYKIEKNNQMVEILEGGLGGLGNVSLKRHSQIGGSNPRTENQKVNIKLVLKLQSDIIFIGYPNAGKSSMLNELTNTDVKTAPYEFTTLDPQLGLMDGLKLMDLPGLIEGTYEGKGLGTKFLKHTENCRIVAHFVSLENPDPIDTYATLRNEIQKISTDLYDKTEIIILTKSDMLGKDDIAKAEDLFRKKGLPVVSSSIIDDDSITRIKHEFKQLLD